MTPTRGCAVLALFLTTLASGAALDGFQPSVSFDEQQRTWSTDDGVRILVNAHAEL
jgi:hypothetical protein